MEFQKTELNTILKPFRVDLGTDVNTIENACKFLKTYNKTEKNFFQAVFVVYKAYFVLIPERDKICEILIENIFNKESEFVDGLKSCHREAEKDNYGKDMYHLVNMIYIILVNFSYHCSSFAERVWHNKPLMDLLRTNMETMRVDLCNERKRGILYDSVSVLFNVINSKKESLPSKTEDALRLVSSTARKMEKDAYSELDLLCTSTLSLSVQIKDDSQFYEMTVDLMNFLLGWIQTAINNRSHEHNCFSLKELLVILHKMVQFANVSVMFCEDSFLTKLNKSLETVPDHHKAALIEVVKVGKLCTNKDDLTSFKTLKSICTILNTVEIERVLSPKIHYKFDIFLSYCHKETEIVNEILIELRKCDFKIWFDKNEMTGTTTEAMIDGIKSSPILLAALSNGYIASKTCMKELAFAMEKEKSVILLKVDSSFKPDDTFVFLYQNLNRHKLLPKISTRESLEPVIMEVERILKS